MRSFLGKLATINEETLTTKEQKLVNYIKNNIPTIVNSNMRVEVLAQKAEIGFSAVYGLLKKLKIQGYRDFAISLVNDAEAQLIDIPENDENVRFNYISLIQHNYSMIQKTQIRNSIDLMRKAERIFSCNWENNLLGPAQELSNFFYGIDKNCYMIDNDQDTITNMIEKATENDLFIFYTKYGNSSRLETFISLIKEKGSKIIYISGKVPAKSVEEIIDSYHTLIIDNPDQDKSKIPTSKSVPFHYVNDLLIYHFINAKIK